MPSTLDYPVDLIARVLDAGVRGRNEALVRRVSTDTRKVEDGDLFFALSGERFDAHQFVGQALEKGAVAAVVQAGRIPADAAKAGTLLEVPDPLLALGNLGRWHRDRMPARMVAVTGSVGKTTTKDLIHSVLAQQYATLKSPGNLNAEIGLPLTLLELRPEHRAAVVEMAMRGSGQIRYLARIARPEVAVITNIGLSHIELLGSQDAIAAAKAEVLDFLPVGGTAILNADDRYFDFLRSRVPDGARVSAYGAGRVGAEGAAGVYLGTGLREKSTGGPMGSRFTLRLAGARSVRWAWIPLLGRHNMLNAVAAAATGQALGVSPQRIHRGLAEAEISGMRMAVHMLPDGSTVLDDAYNASSPSAMEAALEVLGEAPALRKIAVLGNMLELGPAAEQAHREVGAVIARVDPSLLITVGDHAALMGESAVAAGMAAGNVITCASNDEALERLRPLRRPGDVILVKGSRGMAMESIVRELTGGGAA